MMTQAPQVGDYVFIGRPPRNYRVQHRWWDASGNPDQQPRLRCYLVVHHGPLQ